MTASGSADPPGVAAAAAPDPEPADVAAVERAARRLRGLAHVTPVVTSRTVDQRVGARVFAKAENLQRGGAFKFRGAANALLALPPQERARGVVAFSSGNHAQAVALAARINGVAATIVMPSDAPASKMAATRGYGAEVVTYDRYAQDREAMAHALAVERKATVIPPYDHWDVIAGQGTAALELSAEVGGLDVVVVPVGGGGLIAGTALATAASNPAARLVGVEPALRTVARDALRQGHPVSAPITRTIADGQQTPSLGDRPLHVITRLVDEIVGIDDADLVATMRFAFERLKLVLEPSGAAGLAALLAGVIDVEGLRVGVILSGGNIDVDRFRVLTR